MTLPFLVELRETQYKAPLTLTTKKQFTKKATCDDTTLLSKLTKTSQNPIDGYKRTPKQEADLQKMKTGKKWLTLQVLVSRSVSYRYIVPLSERENFKRCGLKHITVLYLNIWSHS